MDKALAHQLGEALMCWGVLLPLALLTIWGVSHVIEWAGLAWLYGPAWRPFGF